MAQIYAYGSSTIYGLWHREGGGSAIQGGELVQCGFVERIKAEMFRRSMEESDPDRRLHDDVFNQGATNQTIRSTLRSLEADMKNRADRGGKGRVIGIFLLGAIESSTIGRDGQDTGEFIVPPEEFSEALRTLGKLCTENAIIPIFIGIPPINDKETHPFAQSGNFFDTGNRQLYDALVREHARKVKAPFIETWVELGGENAVNDGIMSDDHLHIGPKGHDMLYDLVMAEINRIKPYSPEPELIQA